MKRNVLTSLTVAALFGGYCLYTAALGPLTRPRVLPDEQVTATAAPEIKPLSITSRMARTHLTGHNWVASAKYQLQRGEESFIYFHSQRRIGDDRQNKMRVTPFAMVWVDPRSEDGNAAYTMVCDSAVIEFESKVQLGMSGRIIGGRLDGDVQITGPDGLEVHGQNFLFEEKALRLHSDNPIQFAFGPRPGHFEQVRGSAERIDVTLDEATESVLGHDMPRVGGLRQVKLAKNVSLNLVMDDGGEPAPVQVLCKTQLIYDVGQMIATFVDDVRVRRMTSRPEDPQMFDWLECDHLQLMFTESAAARQEALAGDTAVEGEIVQVSATPSRKRRRDKLGISLDLEFQRLSAIGSSLKLGSEENDLIARMEQLFYNIETRTIEMRNTAGDVEARYANDLLSCPLIRLHHDHDDKIESAECLGAGSVVRQDPETSQVDVEASWSEHLILRPDEDPALDVLEISGEGRILQPQQKTGIVADSLTAWLDSQAVDSADGDLQATFINADTNRGLPVKKIRATADVALVSPRLHLETQSLEATFVAGEVSASSDDGGSLTSPSAKEGNPEVVPQPVVVAADAVTAQLLLDPTTEKTDVLTLVASNGVTISRASSGTETAGGPGDESFSIDAEELELRNRDGAHVLRLLGKPARIRHARAEIEGNEMYFDRAGNTAMVEGEGALFVWVDSDLEGETLEVPEKLLVRWNDQMKFNGERADFLGQVRTKLEDSNMLCERMMIQLDRKLTFAENQQQPDDLQIQRVECHEGVECEYVEWERDASRLNGIRKLQVANFTFDCLSGEIHAQGPGRIDDWQLAGQRRRIRIDPTLTDQAPQSRRNGHAKWEYTRVNFAGEMTGNQRERYVTLNDRVRVMHGPVERALDVIDRDEFSLDSSTARNSIWIGSDTLQVRLVPGENDGLDTASVLARGNAELQGKVMGARADSISYDESNEMFTLKGRGNEAYLWHQEKPGSPTRETLARTIQFVPSRYEITVDGVRGIQGAQ